MQQVQRIFDLEMAGSCKNGKVIRRIVDLAVKIAKIENGGLRVAEREILIHNRIPEIPTMENSSEIRADIPQTLDYGSGSEIQIGRPSYVSSFLQFIGLDRSK